MAMRYRFGSMLATVALHAPCRGVAALYKLIEAYAATITGARLLDCRSCAREKSYVGERLCEDMLFEGR